MKTNIFKSMLPLLAVVLAVAGVFAFNPSNASTTANPIIGYADSHIPCSVQVWCSTVGEFECTSDSGQPAYLKSGLSGTTCNMPLFRL